MNTENNCPSCHRPLAPDAPRGLCPECLMRAGFGTGAATKPDELTHTPPFAPPSPAELGKLFPQLEIVELLGRGGMGAVYKARQPALDRWVALKVLPPQSTTRPGFADRFNREARALARLNHPNIVAVYDYGQAGGMPYFVMEYVEGVTLRRLVQERRLAAREALRIVPQICEALQFAHDEGVVHRDIKPENILLDTKGRVKIADFGIAKLVTGEEADHTLTRDQVLGTPHYMAPEQVEHPQAVDHRADIYSLGVVFYEMLTGELPLGKFQPPSKKVEVDVRLDEVVLHSLEKEPERRYQHASQVKTDIETIARTVSDAPRHTEDSAGARAAQEVRNPADWLLATGILNWLTIPMLVLAMLYLGGPTHLHTAPMLLALVAALFLSSFIIYAALKMRQLEAYRTALIGSILAIVVTPGNIIGLPVGIWSLVVLGRREVRDAFDKGYRMRGTAHPGAAQTAARPDRFWRRFAVAAAVVLLLLILVPLGIVLIGMLLPTLHRAREVARPAVATEISQAVPGNALGGASASGDPQASATLFGPVVERVLESVAVQRPIKGEDLDAGREIEVPADLEAGGEDRFFHWLAVQGVDVLAFAHKNSWDLWVAPKLAAVPSALWEQPAAADVASALASGAVGLERAEPDAKEGFVSYRLPDVITPLTFAFQTAAGGVGLLQITGFTDNPRGVNIRYRLGPSAASSANPAAQAKPGEYKVTLANGATLEVVAIARNPRGAVSWWQPDGTPRATPPVNILELPKLAPTTGPEITVIPENEFLVYVRRELPAGVDLHSFQPRYAPPPAGVELPATVQEIGSPARSSAHLVWFVEPPDTVNYREALACGPWEPVSVYDVEKKTTRDLERGVIALWSEPRYERGALHFDVMHSADRDQYALRMVARLRNGGSENLVFHSGVLAGSPAKGFALIHGSERETKTRLQQVKELVIERTPWTRGEIRGIALKPRTAE